MNTLNAYITRNEPTRPQFPCLMEGNGFIVLFHAQDRGTVIASEGGLYDVGHYSDAWATDLFKPFSGNVTVGEPSSVSGGQTGGVTGGAEFIDLSDALRLSDVLLGRDLGNYGRDAGDFSGGRFGNAVRSEAAGTASQGSPTATAAAADNLDVQQAVQMLAEALTAAGIANIEGLHITAVRGNGAAA